MVLKTAQGVSEEEKKKKKMGTRATYIYPAKTVQGVRHSFRVFGNLFCISKEKDHMCKHSRDISETTQADEEQQSKRLKGSKAQGLRCAIAKLKNLRLRKLKPNKTKVIEKSASKAAIEPIELNKEETPDSPNLTIINDILEEILITVINSSDEDAINQTDSEAAFGTINDLQSLQQACREGLDVSLDECVGKVEFREETSPSANELKFSFPVKSLSPEDKVALCKTFFSKGQRKQEIRPDQEWMKEISEEDEVEEREIEETVRDIAKSKVIGGSSWTYHEEQSSWPQLFSSNSHKIDQGGSPPRAQNPICAITISAAETFKQSQAHKEIEKCKEDIMRLVEQTPVGGNTTSANTAANLMNARQMFGISTPCFTSTYQSKPSNQMNTYASTQGESPWVSSSAFAHPWGTSDKEYVPKPEPKQPAPWDDPVIPALIEDLKLLLPKPKKIQIEVTREEEYGSFPMTVALEPWMRAMKMSGSEREDCLRVMFENHSFVWSRQDIKTQIEHFHRLTDLSKSNSAAKGSQQDEFMSEKKMRRYEQLMATSPPETSFVTPSSTNGSKEISKPETELNTTLPTDERTLKKMGNGYIQPMLEIMRQVNPSMKLKTGANVFTCAQKPQDNLCYAFASVTGLMSIDSIRHAAALTEGYVGDALTKFTASSPDEEKYQIVQKLAEEMSTKIETMQHEGEDASVFSQYLLDRLCSEGIVSQNVFRQHVKAWSNCLSCGGVRKSEVQVSMTDHNNQRPVAEEGGKCTMEEDCRDGEYYQYSDLLNSPDSVIKVVSSRKDSATYKQSEEVPYTIKGMGDAEYELKFATIHLGDSPEAGHFVTVISNPGDRADCVLVDDGNVSKIKPSDFDKFRKSAFFAGYELLDAKTIPKPSKETIAQAMRKVDACQKLAALKRVSKVMESCKRMIDKSFYETEKRNAFKQIIEKNLCIDEAGSLLREEEEANSLAKRLVDEIDNHQRKPLSSRRKAKYRMGFSEDRISFQHVERLARSKVFGTGARLLEHAEKCQSQTGGPELVCANCQKTDAGIMFQCFHCLTIRCMTDMKSHIRKSRCAVNREINPRGFLHTPRKHATGKWGNKNMTLTVIRPRLSGNKTQYILDENGRDSMSMVIRTQSTPHFKSDYDNYKGVQTDNGTAWLGEGYSLNPQLPRSEDKKRWIGAVEEVKHKDIDGIQDPDNFPIWSLHTKHWSVKDTPAQMGAVNMNLDGHVAKNPANLEVKEVLEFIQVAKDSGQVKKMVVRRPGKPDEELSFIKPLEADEEKPDVDEDVFQKMDNNQVNLKYRMSKVRLPAEQFYKEVRKPNVPYKFINGGRNLCWINSSTQLLFSALPDIAENLTAVLNQDCTFSGNMDLPKLLMETIANPASQEQCLEKLRDLVMPDYQGKPGPASVSFEQTVKMLHKQAPESVKDFSAKKLLSRPRKPCPTKTCDGSFEAYNRTYDKQILTFIHEERKDGLSAQNCIDRSVVDQGTQMQRCTNGHMHRMTADVTFPKMPKTFMMTAYDGTLDQESSMEVKFEGRTYMADSIIKHTRDHHYFSGKFENWQRVDDFEYSNQWKQQYLHSPRENALMVGTEKLFDNLGVVCYKLKETERNQETTDKDTNKRVNFHTVTDSGQQVLCARNNGNKCYVIGCMAALLANPHIHNIFRNCAGEDPTEIEQYLQNLCRNSTIVENIEEWKQLVVRECSTKFDLLQNFELDGQQDAMEFFQGAWQTFCHIPDTRDEEGLLIQKAPMSLKNREALQKTVGHTTVTTTNCTEKDCNKSDKKESHDIVFPVDISDDSNECVNSCMKAQFQMSAPYENNKCDSCGNQNALFQQQASVSNPLPVFIAQLVRFDNELNKNTRPVRVNEVLKEGSLSGYRLTSAILHEGTSMKGGHYTQVQCDIVSGKWIKTNDNLYQELTQEEAMEELKNHGYIFLYSPPAQFPPPLKTEQNMKAKAQPARGDTSRRATKRKQPDHRSSSLKRTKTSDFLTRNGPPEEEERIPQIPAQTNSVQSDVRTPTVERIAASIKAQQGSTKQRISDPENFATAKLKQLFGHDDFKSHEQMDAATEMIHGGRDMLVLMPTGHGKSVTFMLPAALLEKQLAIVISPLIALATDQVTALEKIGIEARLLSAQVLPIKNHNFSLFDHNTFKCSYQSWVRSRPI